MSNRELIAEAAERAVALSDDGQWPEFRDVGTAEILRRLATALSAHEWQPIETAPMGEYTERQFTTAKGEQRTATDYTPQWAWTFRHTDGHMTPSHWIPKEERWNGYTKGAPPTHWLWFRPAPPTE